MPLSAATLLSPVANPGKVVAAPVNYQKHLDEVRGDEGLHHQNPINTIHKAGLFLKATSALAGAGEGIALRKLDRRNDHEIELAFVIGKTARNVIEGRRPRTTSPATPSDSTSRFAVPRNEASGSRPTPTPSSGPWLVTADEIPEPNALDLNLSVNGQPRQSPTPGT